eukprot:7710506-Lingulodinium_polyedra.AAC.1
MDVASVLADLVDFSTGHRVLDRLQQPKAHRLAEGVVKLLQDNRDHLLQQSQGRAVLAWYSSDGTPLLSRHTATHKIGTHQVLRRYGISSEHLVQRAMYTSTDSQGQACSCVVMEAPRPLAAGKKAGNLFTAACAMLPVVRTKKEAGIILNAFCFDRALF